MSHLIIPIAHTLSSKSSEYVCIITLPLGTLVVTKYFKEANVILSIAGTRSKIEYKFLITITKLKKKESCESNMIDQSKNNV